MLRSTIAPFVRQSLNSFVRTYRRSGRRGPRDQAGVRIQQNIFRNKEALEEDPEISYESDFSTVAESHREHEEELKLRREQLKYHITKKKYFRTEKQPNFLTWAEKENIRFLHKQDPNDWSPQRLSESFPATEEVICKILKAKWTPKNMDRIQQHDETVKNNWQLYKAKKIDNLDPELLEHLEKFSNRNFDSSQNAFVKSKVNQIEFQFPKPQSTEFLKIITSCKSRTTDSDQNLIGKEKPNQLRLPQEENQTKELDLPQTHVKKSMTYDELVKVSGMPSNSEVEDYLNVSLHDTPNTNVTAETSPQKIINDELATTQNTSEITYQDETEEPINLTLADVSSSKHIQKYVSKTGALASTAKHLPEPFQERIRIPKRLQKAGSVYKLYDCFYDDKGLFLYRVPGLRN